MSKRNPGLPRRERDYYPTPYAAVPPLIPHLRAARIRRFAEPCCGNGSLIRHLESFGLTCGYRGDIADGRDALAIESFAEPPITNPPYGRAVMHALLWHFLHTTAFTWLLLELDWTATKQAEPLLRHASDIVPIGRLKWIENSPSVGFDNFAWLRFAGDHQAGPIFHTGTGTRTMTCAACGRPFIPTRSDAKFCDHACRQRTYERRLSVR